MSPCILLFIGKWLPLPPSASPSCPACGSPDGSLGHRYWRCPHIRPLVREAFNIVGRPPDLQAWIFGTGLIEDDLAILASAKSRINRYLVQVGLARPSSTPSSPGGEHYRGGGEHLADCI
ncbi:hypothetical protein LAZ67_3003963 [Cordylochernes scorpioides]|uniref:Uncharacterized protein n=1 Tax=Cordylochernes scorpioides TaxID=51811 RepID=A0ABY6K979_9ARAC|nr:hypothetical protein LAZ67_3003963 [Cordylochernes scorpioides]